MADRHPSPFRLIDPVFDPPLAVQERSREFVSKVMWTFASTQSEHPHWYIVRGRMPRHLVADYDQLWRDTLAHGYRGRFYSVVHWYLNVGDGFRYWSCTTKDCAAASKPCPLARYGIGCVINRAENSDLPPTQLRLLGA